VHRIIEIIFRHYRQVLRGIVAYLPALCPDHFLDAILVLKAAERHSTGPALNLGPQFLGVITVAFSIAGPLYFFQKSRKGLALSSE